MIFNLLINNFTKNKLVQNNEEIKSEKIISENKIQEKNIDVENEFNNNDEIKYDELNWYIEIASINLKAPINETVNMDVLNYYVGHFEETPKTYGNISLAGHNRGYAKNYFQDLNKLKKGEEIKYKYNNFEKKYLIEKIEIIKNTNWSFLENTKENKITLITCIENKPDLRLCIQAIEK